EGQSATETFTVTFDDNNGDLATQSVTVTVHRSDETPTIVGGSTVATGSVTEDATTPDLTATGTIAFNDVDLIDTHSATAVAAGTNTLGGVLTFGAASESATTEGGTIGWTYNSFPTRRSSDLEGQSATETFTV